MLIDDLKPNAAKVPFIESHKMLTGIPALCHTRTVNSDRTEIGSDAKKIQELTL